MTNEEAEEQREAARKADSEKAAKERAMSSKERAEETSQRNAERKEKKEQAADVLKSGSASSVSRDIAEQGGSLGRKLEREIRRFEQTGRVSNWLAGETIKAESKQSAAQQAAFSRAVVEVIQTTPSAFLDLGVTAPPLLLPKRKPEVPVEGEAATTINECRVLGLYVNNDDVWISAGAVNGDLINGLDPLDGKFIASTGSGVVYVRINIDQDTGEIDASVERGASVPSNTDSRKNIPVGAYEITNNGTTVSNIGCGNINVSLCRNWFVADPPYFTVNISR